MAGLSFQEKLDAVLVGMVARGNASKVAELLSKGARVDARYEDFTPLIAAAYRGHTDVCELLLDKGNANIEETMPGRGTALTIAADNGHASTVALLLTKGARVDSRNEQGFTPLLAAAFEGHIDVCELLLKTGKANVKETKKRLHTFAFCSQLWPH